MFSTWRFAVSKAQRQERYKTSGGAFDLVKVEALVPPAYRERLLDLAKSFREEHRRNKDEVAAIADRVREACKRHPPRRYTTLPDIDRIVVTSVNVPFPKNIEAKTLARGLTSNTVPKGFSGHFERFLGELSLTEILRFCDRHEIKAPTLAKFVRKQSRRLALHRPELEEHLRGIVPNF
jgi:hypothetical protein